MDPLLLAGAAAAGLMLVLRKKKPPATVTPAPGAGPPGTAPDLPAPGSAPPGQQVPAPPVWPGAKMSLEQAQAIAAHAVWFGSEGKEPTSFEGRTRKPGQSTSDWLTNYAFWGTYPTAPTIPAGWNTKVGWKPWVDAWVRINGTVKSMLESAGPYWEA